MQAHENAGCQCGVLNAPNQDSSMRTDARPIKAIPYHVKTFRDGGSIAISGT